MSDEERPDTQPAADDRDSTALPTQGSVISTPGRLQRVVAAWRALPQRRAERPVVDVALRLLERHREMAGSLMAGALGYHRAVCSGFAGDRGA
jgi:hypothetical protein